MTDDDAAPLARPASCTELFTAFTALALQGFGGVLAVAQRVLCEDRRWLSKAEFLEMLALAQVLPGPNVCNLSLMVGDRWFGTRGAFAALAGMMAVPLLIVLAAIALYAQFASHPLVAGALRGMGAVAAGMIVGTAVKLAGPLRASPLGLPVVALLGGACFAAVALLRWPLVWVLLGLGLLACGLAWRRLAPSAERGA
ncbi:chromate transporter [uncultured Methylibium sp.]|uniref:chromate transporter n=1 Tax=uncultured Methylibium sp. TaxID=381093 RepID=UPI0025F9A256|nr:chromate transporter [uncultured Methylibium sp.]